MQMVCAVAFHLIRLRLTANPPSPQGEGLRAAIPWLPLEGKLSPQRLMRWKLWSHSTVKESKSIRRLRQFQPLVVLAGQADRPLVLEQ